jgi:anti-sigma factor RsiW
VTPDELPTTNSDEIACVEVVEIVTDYLEGVLTDAGVRRLERHLETCPGCTEYLEQMRAIAGSLSGLIDDPIAP